jgi:hypothetical protein
MQLIKKLFGVPPPPLNAASAQFHESETTTEQGSRSAPRRELVQVVLRDTMRRHGIPAAWIDCRILSVVSRKAVTGMHVQFVVRQSAGRLLTYVPALQSSFMEEIGRFDPQVSEWLFSLSWQFEGWVGDASPVMPDPGVWTGSSAAPTPSSPTVSVPVPATVRATAAVAVPATVAGPVPKSPAATGRSADEDDVMKDLQALFAIRDAALHPDAAHVRHVDFQGTRPPSDDDDLAGAAPLPAPGQK